jgi:hypothetical protein
MDLSDTSLQVDGHLVYFILFKITESRNKMTVFKDGLILLSEEP